MTRMQQETTGVSWSICAVSIMREVYLHNKSHIARKLSRETLTLRLMTTRKMSLQPS